MVVTCLLGMRIPVGPVSEHNPVWSARFGGHTCIGDTEAAELCSAGQPRAAVPTWFSAGQAVAVPTWFMETE